MKLDIVIVTYQSYRWMKDCIESIEKSKGIKKEDIFLYVIDNVSTDKTVELLKQLKKETTLGGFHILSSKENLGFGRANNVAAKAGKSEYIFFLNPDTKLEEDTLFEMKQEIEHSDESFGMWELRQKPYEHPKLYDILTGETSWASGACFVIQRALFEQIGGFDKNIFMYAEDVDISWNVRMHGKKIKYIPKATLNHYCYQEAGQIKPTQYYFSLINNLNLRLKYGNYRKVARWYVEVFKILRRRGPFAGSRKGIVKEYFKNLKYTFYYAHWKHRKENKKLIKNFHPDFLMFDYEVNRVGAFVENTDIKESPLVSIVIRTVARPNVLRETLQSIRKQTYKNIEVVVVEDGKNISQPMIEKEFKDLNLVYHATGKKVGRCMAGNIGLEKAHGKYLNFLDDDDLFYADHVETLVKALEKNPEYKIAYALGYESKIEVKSREPEYIYKEHAKQLAHNKPFSRITLLTCNAFPIQTVMFAKEIYLKYGGFDLELDSLEDWELWTRYALENPFLFVPKVTSLYRVPYQVEEYSKRQEEIDYYYQLARNKIFARKIVIKPEELLDEVKYI